MPSFARLAILTMLFGTTLAAETVDGLYRGETVITGQDNLAERQRGFRETLEQVLVKVSGDPALVGREGFGRLLDRAADYVLRFDYEDRKKGIQISDEQGTRDRSYVFRVDFDPARIDRAIAELGGKPWGGERPRVLVLLGIRDLAGDYVLGRDSERGYGQREVLRALEKRRGLPLVLPRMDEAERRTLRFADLAAGGSELAGALAAAYGADAVLLGTMTVTPAGYWDTRWTLRHQGREVGWTVEGTTFDRAIADGIGHATRVLAGS